MCERLHRSRDHNRIRCDLHASVDGLDAPPDGITMTEGKALLVEFMGLQASFKQIHEVSIPFQSAVQHKIVG